MKKNLLQKITDKIFEIQDIFLKKKYGKTLEYSSSMIKNKAANGITLTLSSKLEDIRKEIYDNVKKLAKENSDNLFKLFEISKNEGAKFYILKNADILLKPISEKQGFIAPKKGFPALYLNLLTSKTFSFKSNEIFVFENEKLSPYSLIYNFYMWYSFKKGLPGFQEEALIIKNIEKNDNFDNLKYEEIMELKQALNRERDALKFTVDFMKEYEGSKNAYEKLKDKENGANI